MAIDLAIAGLIFGLIGFGLGAAALYKVNQFVTQGSVLQNTELTKVTCGKAASVEPEIMRVIGLNFVLAFHTTCSMTYSHPLLLRTQLQNPAVNSGEIERPTQD